MLTVKEVSKMTGVSIRTLHFYDETGLLKPAEVTEAGYRLYDEKCLERLQQILLFRELDFPLKEIGRIIDSPDFDRDKALKQQIEMLILQKEHVEKLIDLARDLQKKGGNYMNFDAFDRQKMKKYAKEAQKQWGGTEAYKEYETRSADYSEEKQKDLADGLYDIFREFGKLRKGEPEGAEAQAKVAKLKDYITANYYKCTDIILGGLGKMYAAGGEMTENIDKAGGEGTAVFAAEAIEAYCAKA